ncbi:hypothetical protein Ancab_020971 [Ancistrocladus abbreviatus]
MGVEGKMGFSSPPYIGPEELLFDGFSRDAKRLGLHIEFRAKEASVEFSFNHLQWLDIITAFWEESQMFIKFVTAQSPVLQTMCIWVSASVPSGLNLASVRTKLASFP